jgi:hypothetical protein
MLCDGIFTVAMTLLVLELKAPDLPRHAPSAEIWHALREHGLSFVGFWADVPPGRTVLVPSTIGSFNISGE